MNDEGHSSGLSGPLPEAVADSDAVTRPVTIAGTDSVADTDTATATVVAEVEA